MWASLSSLNCEASVKGSSANIILFIPSTDQALILILWSTTMKTLGSYPTLVRYSPITETSIQWETDQERSTPKSSTTRVFTNGTSLWQTTREYQQSHIPTSQLWLLVCYSSPEYHQSPNTDGHLIWASSESKYVAYGRKACLASERRFCLQHSRPNCLPLPQVAFPLLGYS